MSFFNQSILNQVEEYQCHLVSFDIFDTLAHRRCATPSDVFKYAYEQVFKQLNLPLTGEEYVELRQHSESKARRESVEKDICLNEIFAQLPFSTEVSECLQEAELKAERSLGFLNDEILELIISLQKQGIKVIFISDMYLSSKQIQQCFFHKTEFLKNIPLYVSSELKKTKYTGELFKVVQHKEQVDVSSWLHLGDHFDSDFRSAQLLGIHANHYASVFDTDYIYQTEKRVFNTSSSFNAVRILATLNAQKVQFPSAYQLGAYTWGPVLLSFSDWVIDKAISQGYEHIICIMREGKVFKQAIDKRIEDRGVKLNTYLLYASRRSTLLASIKTKEPGWLASMFQVMVLRRDYSVSDLYNDLSLPIDAVYQQFSNSLLASSENIYFQGSSLYTYLKSILEENENWIEQAIQTQKKLFIDYYNHTVVEPISNCIVLDFGGGGSIQHQLQLIFSESAGSNLLFYSSERIYRHSSVMVFSSFLGAHNDAWNCRALFNRSCEAIEALFVINSGTTIGYERSATLVTPICEKKRKENQGIVENFQAGIDSFLFMFHKYGFLHIHHKQAVAIMSRFMKYPLKEEACLYTQIYHPDHNNTSIISVAQINKVKEHGVDEVLDQLTRDSGVWKNHIIWPEAALSIINQQKLFLRSGLMSSEGSAHIDMLLSKITEKGWKIFSVYGAGQFFYKLAPRLEDCGLTIEYVIDRKAEFSEFEVLNYKVCMLSHALEQGSVCFVIASYAFTDEIAALIYKNANNCGIKNIEILSL